jgi:pimeloyl-ACP methyl ester carboxylesterase
MVPDGPEQVFYNDCTPEVAAASAARIGPQSLSACKQPLTAAAWETIPSTYVVADKDAGLPQVVQEAMAAGRVVHVDAGHSPFPSRPTELADLIAEAPSA